jgi:glutamate 5-kinase
LVILSDVDGLLERDRKTVVPLVDKISAEIKALAGSTGKKTSVGGMITKLEACRIATDSGTPCVIANGRKKDIIKTCVAEPAASGTLFLPQKEFLAAKSRWMAFSAKPKGKIIVDDGCHKALLNKKSLLSVGILTCEGDFSCGDIVSLRNKCGCEFGRGKVRISAKELEKVKGAHFGKEIIHRDEIVITHGNW